MTTSSHSSRASLPEWQKVAAHAAATGSTQVWVARLDFLPEPAFADALRSLCAPFAQPAPTKTPP